MTTHRSITTPRFLLLIRSTMQERHNIKSSTRRTIFFNLVNSFVFVLINTSIFYLYTTNNESLNDDSLLTSLSATFQCCKLAKDESYGFFTDISDFHWKKAQEIHATIFPNHRKDISLYSNGIDDRGKTEQLKMSNWWNGENFQEEFHCAFAQRIPSTGEADGPKWVCDPYRIAAKQAAAKNQKKENNKDGCLVYSVGSNGNVMFERGVKEEISQDCEIHTFDLIGQNKRNGDFATAMQPYGEFHHWGISTEIQAKQHEITKQGYKCKTLKQTMEELGHTGRSIDIFKINCEWCEWQTFYSWLEADIHQILVETHNAPMPNARDFFYTLHDNGYIIFSKEANYLNAAGCVKFAFLKLKTSFLSTEACTTR